jgi:hypothetical protein
MPMPALVFSMPMPSPAYYMPILSWKSATFHPHHESLPLPKNKINNPQEIKSAFMALISCKLYFICETDIAHEHNLFVH